MALRCSLECPLSQNLRQVLFVLCAAAQVTGGSSPCVACLAASAGEAPPASACSTAVARTDVGPALVMPTRH